MVKDKYLSDLLAINEKLKLEKTKIAISPGDTLAGIATRQFLQVLSPTLLRSLDKIGIGPGRYF